MEQDIFPMEECLEAQRNELDEEIQKILNDSKLKIPVKEF